MSGRGPVVGVFVQKEENSKLFSRTKLYSFTHLQDEAIGEYMGNCHIFASLLNPFSAPMVTDDRQSKRGEMELWENPRK